MGYSYRRAPAGSGVFAVVRWAMSRNRSGQNLACDKEKLFSASSLLGPLPQNICKSSWTVVQDASILASCSGAGCTYWCEIIETSERWLLLFLALLHMSLGDSLLKEWGLCGGDLNYLAWLCSISSNLWNEIYLISWAEEWKSTKGCPALKNM